MASAGSNIAGTPGLTQGKAAQVAKFAKLVPTLKGLTDLASDAASDSGNSNPSLSNGLELLDTIGLETGLDFLRKNNLDVSDGLKLLKAAAGDAGSSQSHGSILQLLSAGSLSLGFCLLQKPLKPHSTSWRWFSSFGSFRRGFGYS